MPCNKKNNCQSWRQIRIWRRSLYLDPIQLVDVEAPANKIYHPYFIIYLLSKPIEPLI